MTANAALIALLTLVPCYGSAQASSEIAAIELAAARHLLGRHPAFTIQVAGEILRIPKDAELTIEHERAANGLEDLEFQLRWRRDTR